MNYKFEDACNAKVIGDFVMYTKKLLGCGKFGRVFEGKHKSNNMKVAVKVSPNSVGQDEQSIQAILNSREVQVMKKVTSENLVQFYNIYVTQNNVYLFMEYCDGGTLTQYMKENPNLPDVKVIELFQQIANGFQAMVKENIIHRDLKPENILFNKGVLKIADFGFARFLDGNPQQPQYYTLKGTPLYVPPQIFDDKKYSSQFDIWSFGCILYELCFNQHVLGNVRNLGELKAKLVSFKNQRITIPANKRDRGLIEMLTQMLEYDEDNRIKWKQIFESKLFTMTPLEYLSTRSDFEIIDKKPSIDKFRQANIFARLLEQLQLSKYNYLFLLKWKCIILYFWNYYLLNAQIQNENEQLKQIIDAYQKQVSEQLSLHLKIVRQRIYSPNNISKNSSQEEIKLIANLEKCDNRELMFYVEKFGLGKFDKEIDDNFRKIMKLIKEVLE